MKQAIKDKIKEVFEATPKEVGVGWGKKFKGGKFTGELGVVFLVEKKKPLEELKPEEVLPSSLEIDGEVYKTDVKETGKIRPLVCNPATLANCYNYDAVPPGNRNKVRPLKGGLKITTDNTSAYYGTLGFIAVESTTNALVAVTNNHVAIGNAFSADVRDESNIENEIDNTAYQNSVGISNDIGKVIRYVPISPLIYNQVDGALIGLESSVVSNTESFKQYGLSYALPMEFATTFEIDNLMSTLPEIYSSGARTGAKEGGDCGLAMYAVDVIGNIGPYNNGESSSNVYFNECLVFSRIDNECIFPIDEGDSGSALIANFSGTWKIIGLCFAGGDTVGLANRIDNVASQLNIEYWDGTAKEYIDFSSQEIITVNGQSSSKITSCEGKTFWQIGMDSQSNPC